MSIKFNMKRKISLALILVLMVCMSFTNASFAAEKKNVISQTSITQPSLTQTTRNIFVGKQYNLNLNNKVDGSNYVWSTSDKKVATVTQKGIVKGISKGTATITCNVATKANTYKLSCKVTIIKPSVGLTIKNKVEALIVGQSYDFDRKLLPTTSNDKTTWTSSDPTIAKPDKNGKVTALKLGTVTITAKTLSGYSDTTTFKVVDGTVSTQTELEALLGSGASVITIKTTEAVNLTIPQGDYSKQQLVVIAPKADITNYGTFASVDIKEIKADTWREEAVGNLLNVWAGKSRIIVGENAKVSIEINEAGATLSIVNNGVVEQISITKEAAQTALDISGESKEDIPVVVNVPDITITTSVPLNLDCQKKIELVLLKGAENTQIQAASTEVVPEIKGDITIQVKVGTGDNQTTAKVTPIPTAAPASVSSGGSSSSGSSSNNTPSATPTTAAPTPTTAAPTPTTAASPTPTEFPDLGIGVASGAAITQTVTSSAITAGVTHTVINRGYLSATSYSNSISGPFNVHVLTVDPNTYTGHIAAKKCGGVVNAPVSSTSNIITQGLLDSSIAAVNGGFFMVYDYWGTIGASASLSVTNGEITNEAIPGRSGLLIPDGTLSGIKIGSFTTTMTAASSVSEDAPITITGLNRRPGVKCGVNADFTTHHDTVSKLPNDLVLYDENYGAVTESNLYDRNSTPGQPSIATPLVGVEVAINAEGIVTEVYNTMGGHTVGAGCRILAGLGTSADWLTAYAVTGASIEVNISATMDGQPITFGPNASVMTAGPLLIKDGIKTSAQSWYDDGFQNDAWNGYNPRTVVGIKADGTLLIVTVDGRSNNSRGCTIAELQTMMENLGAVNALNLDGGASTLMTINNVVQNVTSNMGGSARNIGDYLTLIP